ncbi:MAG: metallophosphoesterase [Ilumatobacteraceae bacterium]
MDEVSGYDVIGDVHGCGRLLRRLLDQLGYRRHPRGHWWHPSGRRAVFAGDVIDRGPEQRLAVDTVRAMVDHGSAHLVLGNHELDLIAAMVTEPSAPDSVAPFSGERAGQPTVLSDDQFSSGSSRPGGVAAADADVARPRRPTRRLPRAGAITTSVC